MYLMLSRITRTIIVVATNETHTIREFLEVSFGRVRSGLGKYVEIDPRYFRPAEVDLLIGDPAKAKRQLGLGTQDDLQTTRRDHDGCRRGVARP